jgi:hypothetical protein
LRDAQGRDVTADAQLKASSSQAVLGLDIAYETAGDSDVEWSFGGGVSFSRFDMLQNIERIRTATGAPTKQQIQNYCNATGKCSTALLKTLEETPALLRSMRLTADVTATLWMDTDVTLSGDFYAYQQDPTQVGYFSVAVAGRQSTAGNGIPIAPLRYLVRPEVTHRFGDLSAKLWVQGGHYVESAGGTTAGVGCKVQYKLSKLFRMWLTLSGQNDVDEQGNASKSGSVALGAGYRF